MAEDHSLPGWPKKKLVKEVRRHLSHYGIRPVKSEIWRATWAWAEATDAIRVQMFMKVQNGSEAIVPVGRPQKCLRVTSWRENLGKAIQRHADPENFRLCPACGNPMVLRENRATGGQFWGCTMFHLTGCKGKPDAGRQNTTPQPCHAEHEAVGHRL